MAEPDGTVDVAANLTEKQAAALDILFQKVYVPCFIEKCAQEGLPIKTQADLQEALTLTAKLLQAGVQPETQAVSAASVLKEASQAFDAVQETYTGEGEDEEVVLGKAADAVLQDPEIVAALAGLGTVDQSE